jgi:predicted permease
MSTFINDIKYGFRQLIKNPGFTFVAVLTIALGIGAGTAVFSLVNAILLRSLPVPNPHELRVLQWTGTEPRMRSIEGNYRKIGDRATADSVSAPMFLSLREKGAELADIFGFDPLEDVVVRARHEAFTANGMVVSDNFFSGLGVRPLIGRLFAPGDGNAGSTQNVVISYDWWERHFASNPGVLGQTVILNGTNFTVIGVLPRGFFGIRPGDLRDFYVLITDQSQFLGDSITSSRHWWVRLMARLRPGAKDAQLKTMLDVVFPRQADELMNEPEILVQPGRGGLAFDRNLYRKPLLLMLGIVGLVMLVACANIAGLSLARGAGRQHELAVRAALGAGRWRLIRQSLTESLILASLGGGLGVLVATWGRTAISRLLAGKADGLYYDLSLDMAVLSFSLAATLVTALLSGLLPALQAINVDTLGGLKERGALGTPRLRTGRVLVAAQICISLILLFGAGLYLRTLINLKHVNAGFNTEKLLLFELNPMGAGYNSEEKLVAFYEKVQDSLAVTPGVRGATLTQCHLLNNKYSIGSFRLSSGSERSQKDMRTHRLRVSETFFTTMGIPILYGRELNRADTRAIVVNEAFVQKYSPNENPIGQTMDKIWGAKWYIVGVCRDVKFQNIKQAVPPTTYFPFRSRVPAPACFTIRTKLPPLSLATAVRKTVAAIDPDVPVAHITTQEQLRAGNIGQERLFATLCGALSALALLLSCIGLYGLMAYHVARRTSEIAIRMAIGAQPGDVARPILCEALVLAAIGIGVGLPTVLVITRLIKSQLYDVQPNDPVTLGIVIVALVMVALLAAWIPARRAAKTDPMEALRYE